MAKTKGGTLVSTYYPTKPTGMSCRGAALLVCSLFMVPVNNDVMRERKKAMRGEREWSWHHPGGARTAVVVDLV